MEGLSKKEEAKSQEEHSNFEEQGTFKAAKQGEGASATQRAYEEMRQQEIEWLCVLYEEQHKKEEESLPLKKQLRKKVKPQSP